jgi:DNA polymerase-3 subunit beta
MHFIVTKQHLNKGLQAVSRLASGKMPLPILNNILIEAETGVITLSVSNLELGIQVTVPGKTEEPGKFTVPAKTFHEFIQNCTDSTIEGKVSDNATLVLKTDHTNVKIRGLDASEFPNLPFTTDKPSLQVNAKALKDAIDRAVFATAIDDTRPVLAGVLFLGKNGEFITVATDSHRLAEKRMKLVHLDKEFSVIVPKFAALELSRIAGDEAGDISVIVGDNQIQFEMSNLKIVSQLIEGKYPDYEAIVPKEYRTRVTADTGDLSAGLKTVNLFARDAGNTVKLSVIPGKGMTIESKGDQRGEATNQVTAITEGDELTISFNVKYFLDALTAIQADNIFIEFNGTEKPAILRPANSKEYYSLLMPLRVD